MVKTASPVEISMKAIDKPRVGYNGYTGFHPGKTEILKKGHTNKGWNNLDGKPLKCDILVEHDVAIVCRDGTTLYGDIYRPADQQEKIPCILSWSCFGKKHSGHTQMPKVPWQCGVRPSDLSGLEKFEGVDPAEFCNWGYAVANVDSRGSGNSDGFVEIMGPQDGLDGYDTIEWIAKQEWCNGSVGMAGNSHLAIVQYFVAATQPPSLKAIAPWEGCSDLFREQFVRGGIFYMSNFDRIGKFTILGNNGLEDFDKMYERFPLAGPYWDSKRAELDKIKIPIFIKGTDSASMHTMGSIRAWMQCPSEHKWIKWNGYQEWFDLWVTEASRVELKEYFDCFLKGQNNGFIENTPKCRWTLLRFGDQEPIEHFTIPDYPHPETNYTTLYLAGDNALSPSPIKSEQQVSYDSEEKTDLAEFRYTFEKATTILGIPKIYLHMSCPDYDDMVIYVQIRKYDKNGTVMANINVPTDRRKFKSYYETPKEELAGLIAFHGPIGMLRASHRAIDRSKTYHPQIPFHPHDRFDKIPPGDIVELEIGIWEMGILYEAEETLSVQIYGQANINDITPDQRYLSRQRPDIERNHGRHIIHFGSEKFPSRIILPIVELGDLDFGPK